MTMNDQQATNFITRVFGVLATVASMLGISTQELVYMIFAAVGAIVTVLSFVMGRMDARAKRKQEERRTALYESYLDKRSGRSPALDEADQYTPLPGGESEA
ncbi:hypothetical protein [Serratia liquefaciens]|uniref:hypothetical protein n=1 Tax=Serratia liquefaciens TaxID=614 RepID=UPI001F3A6095|nr:hypothetical protein [Serratia liquefaciens]MCE9939800.1 hypothetical protein [Serratia liquefaciens]DAM25263.1 MAG TPA: ESX-3 secretion system protein EccE3, secretion system, type VII [Caudoviricetes sp.]